MISSQYLKATQMLALKFLLEISSHRTESPETLMNSSFPNGACLIFNAVFITKASYIRFICFKASTFHI